MWRVFVKGQAEMSVRAKSVPGVVVLVGARRWVGRERVVGDARSD
jgi:hypothetical protein